MLTHDNVPPQVNKHNWTCDDLEENYRCDCTNCACKVGGNGNGGGGDGDDGDGCDTGGDGGGDGDGDGGDGTFIMGTSSGGSDIGGWGSMCMR